MKEIRFKFTFNKGWLLLASFILFSLITMGTFRASADTPGFRHYIDEPVNNASFSSESIRVRGWATDVSGIERIEVYVNGTLKGQADYGLVREDVYRAYPEYKESRNSGYQYTIDASTLPQGNHQLLVRAISINGEKLDKTINFSVKRKESRMRMDDPSDSEVYQRDVKVRGWAISDTGIDSVKIYLDGVYLSDASRVERRDVNAAYPGYATGVNSGYEYTIEAGKLSPGNHIIEVRVVEKDGSINTIKRTIKTNTSKMYIDEPSENQEIINKNIKIRGWSISAKGTKAVKIYVDGKYIKDANIGLLRKDVNITYPGYSNGDNSGYEAELDYSTLDSGRHVIKVEAISNDGTKTTSERTISLKNLAPRMWLDSPYEGLTISTTGELAIKGWVLNTKKVTSIGVYIDNVFIGNAQTGLLRKDVNASYPGYPQGDNSGFNYSIQASKLTEGNHKLKLLVKLQDGSEIIQERSISIKKFEPRGVVDAPIEGESLNYRNVTVRGWALGSSAINKIEVYVNGNYIVNAQKNVIRTDVAAAYSEYPHGTNSGYISIISKNNFKEGQNTITLKVLFEDGTSSTYKRNINYSKKPVIMLDPGHGGNDPGTTTTFDGTFYRESHLNLIVSNKIKRKLEALGFKVLMTRTGDTTVPLLDRSKIANEADVDFFLSVHHDSAFPTGLGFSTHYSTYKPGIDTEGIVVRDDIYYDNTPSLAALESKKLAEALATNVTNATNFKNRGSRDHNLSVTKNTNMTSVLIECGFISAPSDMVKIINDAHQERLADSVVMTIYNYYK